MSLKTDAMSNKLITENGGIGFEQNSDPSQSPLSEFLHGIPDA
jgi:hypothetical protein